jgi:5-methyltetrahydrofolate--homocysteine methyltransferase
MLSALRSRVLLSDGATGTQLQALGLPVGACGEAWVLEQPALVRTVHERYVAAGADLLTTNTFGGTRHALSRHGLANHQAHINRCAATIAREVAGPSRWVLGDVGPCGDLLEPYGEVVPSELETDFRDQASALLAGGADAILVETMSDPCEAALGVRAVRAAGAKVVIATFAFQKTSDGFRTMMGSDVAACFNAVIVAGADVVGANCGSQLSLDDYVALARNLTTAAGSVPVILRPNAGSPRLVDGRAVYDESPAALAACVPALISSGLRILGGCCGTSPDHIRAIHTALREAGRRD